MNDAKPYSLKQLNDKTVVLFHGDNLDYRSTDSLKKTLEELVHQGMTHIILDMNNVKFMDSSGLSALLFGKRVSEEGGGTFAIANLHGYVNNLVASTNLNQTITVYSGDWEASLPE